MFFLLWIIVWLALNYFFWGFNFSTALCFFAGLFLIMPILTKFSFSELKYVLKHKKALLVNILLNFIIFPLIAFFIWWSIFSDYRLTIWLILLALIPWWWLLMSWLQHGKANLKLWFSIFAVNLFLFSFAYIFFNLWVDYFVSHFEKKQQTLQTNTQKTSFNTFWNSLYNLPQKENNWWCAIAQVSKEIWVKSVWCFSKEWTKTFIYGIYWFFVLVFLPFILSRLIRKTRIKEFFNKHWWKISKISAFVIISYIFSLKYVQSLSQIQNNILYKMIIWVWLFYLSIFIISFTIYKLSNLPVEDKKAIFWNSYVRFITLSFVLSFLYAIAWKDTSIILIFIIAYFVQISSSVLIKNIVK